MTALLLTLLAQFPEPGVMRVTCPVSPCRAQLTISATIIASRSIAMNTEDLGIIGVDAFKLTVHYISTGIDDATEGTEEFLVMERPGSTESTTVLAQFGTTEKLEITTNSENLLAIRWEQAKPVLAALRSGKHMIAWRRAGRLPKT
jgi:hypothetical protein